MPKKYHAPSDEQLALPLAPNGKCLHCVELATLCGMNPPRMCHKHRTLTEQAVLALCEDVAPEELAQAERAVPNLPDLLLVVAAQSLVMLAITDGGAK